MCCGRWPQQATLSLDLKNSINADKVKQINMKNKILLIIFFVLATSASFAQRVPDWVTNTPTPTNSTYLYVVESAFGTSEISARNQAIARVFQSTAMRLGQPIRSDEINRAVQSGTSFEVISRNYNIPINKVCEYTENKSGNYRVYILCQVAKAGNIPVQFDAFNACYEGANKFYAAEALAADGFDVYKNNRRLSEQSVRSFLANSRAYSLYDNGMSIYKSSVWHKDYGLSTSEGIAYLILAAGGTLAVVGYGFSPLATDEEGDSEALAAAGAAGIGIAAVGGVCLLIRAGVLFYGKSQIRKAVNMYNNGALYSQNAIEMRYGFTGNGVFLSFNF